MRSQLSILVTPRDGVHYQDQLYRNIISSGVEVRYAKGPTPSQTLNILLAPAVLVWWRARGCRILHIHWLFQFSFPWARKRRWARRFMQWWFHLYLRVAQILGLRIVWTAHDLLPHEQVFYDDHRARDELISKATEIIALSEATATEIRALGGQRVRVIPMGSYADPYAVTLTRREARTSFGFNDSDVVIALIGRLEMYKGADLLLLAVAQLPKSSTIKLLLAGWCEDEVYRDELTRLAERANGRVTTKFQWIPDDDLARYFQATDVAVFPFREISNSASVLLAQSFGRPVVIPDLPALCDIPDDGALRFEFGDEAAVEPLVAMLKRVEHLTEAEYREMSTASLSWAIKSDWATIARETINLYWEALRTRDTRKH